jgi:hypothetical protein
VKWSSGVGVYSSGIGRLPMRALGPYWSPYARIMVAP